ncbi:MAG: hypothetical protein P1U56_21685 [Saprospiraceae bacterium]|nr:hypothetical protein [Saprospiraceae bacterium]
MKEIETSKEYEHRHARRFNKTVEFMEDLDLKSMKILNLGPDNPLTDQLVRNGYSITNTEVNLDLDLDYEVVKDPSYGAVVAFEIFEHMVSPFPLLKAIAADKLVISVPLSLWFAKAYWNENDPYDRHYHEFEPRQLKMLLNKANWKIVKEEKVNGHGLKFGIRPILRLFTPRHYFVYCERM